MNRRSFLTALPAVTLLPSVAIARNLEIVREVEFIEYATSSNLNCWRVIRLDGSSFDITQSRSDRIMASVERVFHPNGWTSLIAHGRFYALHNHPNPLYVSYARSHS